MDKALPRSIHVTFAHLEILVLCLRCHFGTIVVWPSKAICPSDTTAYIKKSSHQIHQLLECETTSSHSLPSRLTSHSSKITVSILWIIQISTVHKDSSLLTCLFVHNHRMLQISMYCLCSASWVSALFLQRLQKLAWDEFGYARHRITYSKYSSRNSRSAPSSVAIDMCNFLWLVYIIPQTSRVAQGILTILYHMQSLYHHAKLLCS